MVRVITGLILAALVILGVIYLPAMALKLVIAGLVAIATYEFARMALPRHPTSSPTLLIVLGTLTSLLVMFGERQFSTLIILFPSVLIVTFVFYLLRPHSLEIVLAQISKTVLGVLYAGLLLSFLGLIRDLPVGSAWLFIVLATTFGADTGAYISGHLWGRHKLAPQVSPAKTVEGLIGGLIASIAVAFICKFIIYSGFLVKDCLWVGILVGLIGPMGDLSESLIKRSVGVKDSSNLIPGHGGLLDRVDALLFTSPIVYCYAAYFRS
jgi:phosphatidate cytidylyltransferase